MPAVGESRPAAFDQAVEVGQAVAGLVGDRPQGQERDAGVPRRPRERGALEVDGQALQPGPLGRRPGQPPGADQRAARPRGGREHAGVGGEALAAGLVADLVRRHQVAHPQLGGERAAEAGGDQPPQRGGGHRGGGALGGGGADARDVDREVGPRQPRQGAPLGGNGAHHGDHARAKVTRSRGLLKASRIVLASYPQCMRQFAHRGSRSVP